ncbi:MAG: hypothetical protein WC520_03745 [Candidatus Paceibacterota bacterium]
MDLLVPVILSILFIVIIWWLRKEPALCFVRATLLEAIVGWWIIMAIGQALISHAADPRLVQTMQERLSSALSLWDAALCTLILMFLWFSFYPPARKPYQQAGRVQPRRPT